MVRFTYPTYHKPTKLTSRKQFFDEN